MLTLLEWKGWVVKGFMRIILFPSSKKLCGFWGQFIQLKNFGINSLSYSVHQRIERGEKITKRYLVLENFLQKLYWGNNVPIVNSVPVIACNVISYWKKIFKKEKKKNQKTKMKRADYSGRRPLYPSTMSLGTGLGGIIAWLLFWSPCSF